MVDLLNEGFHKLPFGKVFYKLVYSVHTAKQACNTLDLEYERLRKPPAGGASTTTIMNPDTTVCIVWCPLDKDRSVYDDVELITHEAVHVMQSYMEHIGEDSPSAEFQAYVVAEVMRTLYEDYTRRHGGKNEAAQLQDR